MVNESTESTVKVKHLNRNNIHVTNKLYLLFILWTIYILMLRKTREIIEKAENAL